MLRTHIGETHYFQIHVCLHVQESFGWSDQPDAIVSFHPVIDHVHHRYGAAQILHVSAAISDRPYRFVVRVADHEGVKSLVAQTAATVCVESYQ